MNKRLIIIVLAIFIAFLTIITTIQYVSEKDTSEGYAMQTGEPIAIKDVSYVSNGEEISDAPEAFVRFFNNEALLTLLKSTDGKEYQDISLQRAESAVVESKYENKELNLVMIEKLDRINVYDHDKLIFSGGSIESVLKKNLTSYKWIWVKTYDGSGPDAELDKSLFPRKIGAFTITFHDDGQISGTTDCNNFIGTYTDIGDIQPSLSTSKSCKGSQESEFLKMITGGSVSLQTGSIFKTQETYPKMSIERDQTLIFDKGEKIK